MRAFAVAFAALLAVATPAAGGPGARTRGELTWVTWSPGPTILFESRQGVFSIRGDGSAMRRIAPPTMFYASWAPSGRRIVLGGAEDTGLWTTTPSATSPKRIRRGQAVLPSWSPTGDRIAFFGNRGVVVAAADGSRALRVAAGGSAIFTGPVWSPNGETVAFTRCLRRVEEGDVCESYVRGSGVFTASSRRAGAVKLRAYGHCPSYSRRGKLAFRGGDGVRVSNGDGSGQRVVIRASTHCPTWSPDGRLIAAEVERGVVVRGASLRLFRLPRENAMCPKPVTAPVAWSPDSRFVAVARELTDCGSRNTWRLYVIRIRDGQSRIVVRSPTP
ncbi:MAG TPA: hypothetical protein VG144_13890 [Gaiellaceae bacterium]|nr:hypothetical protein [Gaiellaceae bacterium]